MKDNNTYKVFTEEEFNERVKFWWDVMIKGEFPKSKAVPIQHDKAKRKTKNLGSCHYEDNKVTKLEFSYRLLDGRFSIDTIDDIVKHEIGHALAIFRHGRSQGHNENFHKIGEEFSFNANPIRDIKYREDFDIRQEKINRAKYLIHCSCCDRKWYKDRTSKLIKGIQSDPMNYKCPCNAKGSLKVEVLR